MSEFSLRRKLVLFDVDGTLTPARKKASAEVKAFLEVLRSKVTVGVVGGSDLSKQKEQLGDDIINEVDYSFSENGLIAYKNGILIGKQSIQDYIGEENLKSLINFTLKYIADLDIPIKRGTFIEFRAGMLNISPIGRNCSQQERDEYEVYDLANGIRKSMVQTLQEKFKHLNLTFSIGGQISFDVFPNGWDKTFCLRFIENSEFDEIHFFGDKTFEGGNDWEIFSHPRVIGHTTTSPENTIDLCTQLFLV